MCGKYGIIYGKGSYFVCKVNYLYCYLNYGVMYGIK